MRIDGEWREDLDGELIPTLRAEAQGADGSWVEVYFLIDSGAQRTVLSVDLWRRLGHPGLPAGHGLAGLGGGAGCVRIEAPLRATREDGSPVLFRGPFLALTAPSPLDVSVLGRDLLCHFAVILDQPQRVACLLHGEHRYQIVTG
jgi:hypothetical protein